MKYRGATVLGALLALFALLIIPMAGPTAATGGTIDSMTPASAPPGSSVRVQGSGWTPGTAVLVFFDATQVGSQTPGGAGTIDVTFTVSVSALPGQHTVTAQQGGPVASQYFYVNTDWPQYKFDLGRTGANPYENVLIGGAASTLSRAANYKTIGLVVSSPAVYRNPDPTSTDTYGYVFVGDDQAVNNLAPDPTNDPGGVYGLSPDLNKSWQAQLNDGGVWSSPAIAMVNGTPRLFVGTGRGHVFAFDHLFDVAPNATPIINTFTWKFPDTGIGHYCPTATAGFQTAPLAVNNDVYIVSDNGVVVDINATTGVKKWCTYLGMPVADPKLWDMSALKSAPPSVAYYHPASGPDELIVGGSLNTVGDAKPDDGKLFVIDATPSGNGTILGSWDTKPDTPDGVPITTTPAVADIPQQGGGTKTVAYFGTGVDGVPRRHVYAIDITTPGAPAKLWRNDLGTGNTMPLTSSPVVDLHPPSALGYSPMLFWGGHNGVVCAVDAQSGQHHTWSYQMPISMPNVPAPAVAGGFSDNSKNVVLLGNDDGRAYAIRERSGWAMYNTTVDTPPWSVYGEPVVSNGRLYYGAAVSESNHQTGKVLVYAPTADHGAAPDNAFDGEGTTGACVDT